MPIFQKKFENLFDAVNLLSLPGMLKKYTRWLILSKVAVKALKIKNAPDETVAVWTRHVRKFNNSREQIKKQLTRIPDQSELQKLLSEASLAYKSMIAINEISQTESQNVENFCKMNYRKKT